MGLSILHVLCLLFNKGERWLLHLLISPNTNSKCQNELQPVFYIRVRYIKDMKGDEEVEMGSEMVVNVAVKVVTSNINWPILQNKTTGFLWRRIYPLQSSLSLQLPLTAIFFCP